MKLAIAILTTIILTVSGQPRALAEPGNPRHSHMQCFQTGSCLQVLVDCAVKIETETDYARFYEVIHSYRFVTQLTCFRNEGQVVLSQPGNPGTFTERYTIVPDEDSAVERKRKADNAMRACRNNLDLLKAQYPACGQ